MTEVNYLKGKDKKPSFSYLLEDQEPSMQINTVFGNMPLGSCLSYQLQDFGRPGTKFFSTRNIVKPAYSLHCSIYLDISIVLPGETAYDFGELSENFASCCKNYLSIESMEAHNMEKRTVLQGECKEWLTEHEKRITASNFGRIIYRIQRPSESMLKSISSRKICLMWEAYHMAKARKKLQEPSVLTRCLRRFQILLCLMLVCLCTHYFLSLEQLQMEKCMTHLKIHLMGFLEIKCPFSKRKDTFVQASSDGTFYLEKRGNSFYLEKETIPVAILFIFKGSLESQASSGVTSCLFPWIKCDQCWENLFLPKLSDFFLKHALPCLASY